MTFDGEISEEITSDITDIMECVFDAVQEAVDNPTDIVEIHVFDEETKKNLQNLLYDLSICYPEAENIDVIVETIH